MITFEVFCGNFEKIKERIRLACIKAKREEKEIGILPVTKMQPSNVVEYVYRVGMKMVGENRIQEAIEKMKSVTVPIQWELVGHLQSNKVKLAVQYFERIQSVDSWELAQRIDRLGGEMGRAVRILIEVNAGGDPAKFGVSCGEVGVLLAKVMNLKNVRVEGLMTVAPLHDDLAVAEKTFHRLREIRDRLEEKFAVPLPELSMGMTNDLEVAIKAGSTLLRIGTGLFGSRVPSS